MAKKFRLRNLFEHIPFLDGLRISALSNFCGYGSAWADSTYPIIKVISPGTRQLLDSGQPVIFAVYHGRMVGLLAVVHPKNKLTVLVSRSRDGEIIANGLAKIGYTLARGSPAHKAIEGARQLVAAAKNGQNLALLVDGPRGPQYQVKLGIIRIAQMTGLPVVPFMVTGYINSWMWGWDKFMATCFYSPMLYIYGEPLFVGADAPAEELETIRAHLENTMNQLRESGDNFWKLAKINK